MSPQASGAEYCQAPNIVDCACRNEAIIPLAVTPATTGQPVRLHVARLSLVNLRYPPACPPTASQAGGLLMPPHGSHSADHTAAGISRPVALAIVEQLGYGDSGVKEKLLIVE